MAGAGWKHFWRQSRGAVSLPGAVARAAVRGEAIGRVLELAAQGFLYVGGADRAGVWLESVQNPGIFVGTVLEAGSGFVPQEWQRLEVSLPFFRALLECEDHQVVADLNKGSGVSMIGPLAGMCSAAWMPLRAQQTTLGLALAAYAHPRRVAETETLRRLADEITLAVVQQRERELRELSQTALASGEQLQRAILRGTPVPQILAQIAAEAARHVPATFVALGRSGSGAFRFEAFSGPREWLPLLQDDPLPNVWRTALEEGRMVEVSLETIPGGRPRGGLFTAPPVSRVLALPLQARGDRLGLLLAGLGSPAEPSAELARLESYATLATAALRDEHQRMRAVEAESSSRALLELSSEWVLILDREGVIREASRAAQEHLDLEPARLGRMRLEDLFAPASCSAIAAWRVFASDGLAGGATMPIEGLLPSGQTVRLNVRRGLLGRAEGDVSWRVWVEDVTALRAAEQKGRRTEAELLSVLDSLDSGVLLLDLAGRVRLVNDRFAQLVGLDARETAERADFDSLVRTLSGNFAEPQPFAARWREIFGRGDEACWDELEMMRPTRKVVERFARPVFDADGGRIGWLEVYRDVTSQRMIQSKLLQTEKMAALGQLVSGIAHELNNPLTSIMGYAQLLLGRPPGPERAADAHKIYQEAERAGRIVKNLLLFARETKPERRPVNLNEVVERTLTLRSYELKVENISVEFELDPGLPPTLADATQMQQVVLNLVVNAEQAIQQGRGQGHIRIRTQRLSPQRLALEVADDGPGIPAEIASRIFDPFFTTKPVGVGTGLGLSIVYGIIQEHGGEISVDSQPGRGARFLVELPIVAAPAQEETEDEPVPAPPLAVVAAAEPGPAVPARRERILVVEDEPTVAQLIADVLREEGHRVDTILDSREGLERLGRQEYDLVICDLKMPHLDGRGFYRALMRAGSPLQHRIVFVTGDTLAPHTLEFLEASGLPYLAKPFLVEELKLTVQRAFRLIPADVRAGAAGEPTGWTRGAVRKP